MERSDPEIEVKRLLKELHNGIPSRFYPQLDALRHQISRISTGINVLKEWKEESAVDPSWVKYGFTPMEQDMVVALHKAGATGLTKERLMAQAYANQLDDWPSLKIIDVRAHHIRDKLEAHDAPWWIETVHGVGYVLHEGRGQPRMARDGNHLWTRPTFKPSRLRRALRNKAAQPNPVSKRKPRLSK
jgi:Transcriptional regulatory protein, C terminal